MSQVNNVFISHHHKDDAHVDRLTSLLKRNGLNARNSSIRAKPANQDRIDKGRVKESVIRRLLRMKMKWARTVIVLIGTETYSRKWVNWEIQEAQRQGKNIIGVYEYGLKDNVELPDALKNYATSIVGWNSGCIMDAINGSPLFQQPDGSPASRQDGYHGVC